MSITIGAWIFPTIITAVAWLWVLLSPSDYGGGYINIDVAGFLRFITAIIITIFSWCVYFGIALWMK